ncbi:MAG: hypothetical protein QNJ46_22330 [Leptolyngbyaceae cyanobacterium MO_188.B28]|nr:hypothetical protein [Leptolyngbyaceae cyanobacterium MO_188.B28]
MNFFPSSTLLSAIFMIGIALGCAQADAPQENTTKQTETVAPAIDLEQNSNKAEDTEQNSNEAETSPESEIVATSILALRPGQAWTEVLPGEEAYELMYTENGTLLYQGMVIVSEIRVSGSYAKRLLISDSSPSGNYHLFQACDRLGERSLCWAEFLVNKAENRAQQVSLSKYGVSHWVRWSEDEKYALFPYRSESSFTLRGLDLETGESSGYIDWFCNIDLNSFSWIDNRVFQIQVLDHGENGWPCNDSPRWFREDIAKLFE